MRSQGVVSGQSFGLRAVSLVCITSMCSVTFSQWPLSLFSLWIILLPPSLPHPFIFPLINQCDRCLAPLAWGLMAGGCGFASDGGVTLFQGLAVAKVEAPGHPWHPPPLSDAVVVYPFLPAPFLACPNSHFFYTPSCQLPFSQLIPSSPSNIPLIFLFPLSLYGHLVNTFSYNIHIQMTDLQY